MPLPGARHSVQRRDVLSATCRPSLGARSIGFARDDDRDANGAARSRRSAIASPCHHPSGPKPASPMAPALNGSGSPTPRRRYTRKFMSRCRRAHGDRARTLPPRAGARASGDPAQQQKIPWRSRLKCWPACTEGDSIGVLARAFPFGVSAARLPSKPGGQARSTIIGQYGDNRNICQCYIAFSRIYDLRVNLHRAVARGVPGAVRAFRHQLRLSPNFPVRSLSFQAAFSPMTSLSLMLEEAIYRIDT